VCQEINGVFFGGGIATCGDFVILLGDGACVLQLLNRVKGGV